MPIKSLERLREDKTKTQMTQSFHQYSEDETKIWRQNILNQFNRVSSFSFRNLSITEKLLSKEFHCRTADQK